MLIIALDPGPTQTALVRMDYGRISFHFKGPNENILESLLLVGYPDHLLVIEKIASYGMAVGAEVFETCFWSGRFAQAFGMERVRRITRGEVKMHLCNSMRAKDGNVRQALIDRYGGDAAIGKKKTPGPLYGISGDVWAALAVACTWSDKNAVGAEG